MKLEGQFLQPHGSFLVLCDKNTCGWPSWHRSENSLGPSFACCFFHYLSSPLLFSSFLFSHISTAHLSLSFFVISFFSLFFPFFVILSISICPTYLPSIYSCFFYYRGLIVSKCYPFISGSMIDRSTSLNLTNVSSPCSKMAGHGNQDAIVTVLSIILVYAYLNRAGYLNANVHERYPLYFQAKWIENSLAYPQFPLFCSFKFSTIFAFFYSSRWKFLYYLRLVTTIYHLLAGNSGALHLLRRLSMIFAGGSVCVIWSFYGIAGKGHGLKVYGPILIGNVLRYVNVWSCLCLG